MGEESFDGNCHKADASEPGHVAENVGGIKSLASDVEFKDFSKMGGDACEEIGGEVLFAEELLIAFERAEADIVAGFDIESEFEIVIELEVMEGLLVSPAEEISDEDEACHSVEFFGGGTEMFGEVFRKSFDGHFFEKDGAEGTLPAILENFETGVGEKPVEWVEKAFLSWVDLMDQEQCNPLWHIDLL